MLEPFEHALAEIHARGIAEHGDQWMHRVKAAYNTLVQSYQQLTQKNRHPIDYTELPAEAAYIYAYAMPRAYFTLEMLRRHRAATGKALFGSGRIEIISFGGGPVSELVGLLEYLGDETNGETVESISYRVFDKDGAWKDVADLVLAATVSPIEVTMTYEQLDLADGRACAAVDIRAADLIVFSYIMSELCALEANDEIAQNTRVILVPIKSGAAMLFIDSKQPEFIQYFQRCRQFIGSQRNDDGEGVDLALPELTPTFQAYRDALDREPRMDAAIVSKWLAKA